MFAGFWCVSLVLAIRTPHATACGEFCIVHNMSVAALTWVQKRTLNDGRLGFQVYIVAGVCFFYGQFRAPSSSRARAWVGSSVLSTMEKSPCCFVD